MVIKFQTENGVNVAQSSEYLGKDCDTSLDTLSSTQCHHVVTILLVYVIVLFVLLGSPCYVTTFDVF